MRWSRWGLGAAIAVGGACSSFSGGSTNDSDADSGTVSAVADGSDDVATNASAEPVDAAGYANIVLSDQPLAYWRMTPKTNVTIADETLRGNDLQLNGSGSFDFDAAGIGAPGDHAVGFNGTDQYAVPLDSGVFDFDARKAFTIELWASLRIAPIDTDEEFFHTLAIRTSNDPPHRTGWDLYLTTNQSVSFERGFDGGGVGGSPAGVARAPAFPTRKKFHHYVATYDGMTLQLFVDGTAASIHQNDAGVSLPSVSEALRFGADRTGTHLWPGVIDEIAIYDKALSVDRIQAHRAAASVP